MSGGPPGVSAAGSGASDVAGASAGGAGGATSNSRRQFLQTAAAIGASLAGLEIVAKTVGSLSSHSPGAVNGVFDVAFANSGASSSWHNAKAGEPMKVSDFPGPGNGAMGTAGASGVTVIVLYLTPGSPASGMKGIVPPGMAAYNAACTHLTCTALWRSENEGRQVVPADPGHDFVVCPCHQGSFDPYDSGKVIFGPPPRPLEQLKLVVEGDLIKIRFENYRFGGSTPQV